MAIYEYDCSTCGARIEVLQPMGSRPKTTCGDDCAAGPRIAQRGKGAVARVFSRVNVGGGAGSGGSSDMDGGDFGGDAGPGCGRCGRTGPDVCEN